jgi:hypothetical protein
LFSQSALSNELTKIARHRDEPFMGVPNDVYRFELWVDQKQGERDDYICDGDVYCGGWKEDLKSGEGILRFANGDVFSDKWIKEYRLSTGIMRYANGDVYTGTFWPHITCRAETAR